jgi:hypothetical protein
MQKKITVREVEKLEPGQTIWDSEVSGFHARRQKDAITYVLAYRTDDGRRRWYTIGRCPVRANRG